ncbi:MAG: helix-turn-helix domain-containing protein [Verrucomicrobiales bacterium]|nr:helix-turn-helix transcriptional regulator [Verrucomicrobiota bacterium JB025]
MDKFPSINLHSPGKLTKTIGQRLRQIRLSRGLTQQELAEHSGVSLSTLKLLESQGKGSLQRLARIAAVLGVDAELRDLFRHSTGAESIDAVKRSERQRAPRRKS